MLRQIFYTLTGEWLAPGGQRSGGRRLTRLQATPYGNLACAAVTSARNRVYCASVSGAPIAHWACSTTALAPLLEKYSALRSRAGD
jgi:hypothetical protein